MKALKKILSIILAMVVALSLGAAIIVGTFLLILFSAGGHIGNNDPKSGYYKKEEFWDKEGFQDYTDYCKYYYEDKYDAKFAEDKYYTKVKEDNITEVVGYFEIMEDVMLPERADDYDFDKAQITAGDYVRIESEYIEGTSTYASFDVYLYDVETNILYYIHNNI